LRAAAFLTSIRALSDQAAPGLVRWQTMHHGEVAYVKVSGPEGKLESNGEPIALYYTITSRRLVVSPSRALIERAIDRSEMAEAADTDQARLGKNIAITIERIAIDLLKRCVGGEVERSRQSVAWENIPILNEWKRRFPDQDPVEVHQRFWHETIACPGGGEYIWNAAWQTMESTAFGHAGDPRVAPFTPSPIDAISSARFGLTFDDVEGGGLRGRVSLMR